MMCSLSADYRFLELGRLISRGFGRHEARTIANYELIYVVAGSFEMAEGEESFLLKNGQWRLLRPGMHHGSTAAYPEDLSFYWLHFLPRTPAAQTALLRLPRQGTAARPQRLAELLAGLFAEQREKGATARSFDLRVALILEELLASRGRTAPHRLSEQAQEFIRQHFVENITSGSVAAALHCSAAYLRRVYKADFGVPVSTEILNTRLAYAARLFRFGRGPVKETLFTAGFNDASYFRREFRRRYGVSPREYLAHCRLEISNTE